MKGFLPILLVLCLCLHISKSALADEIRQISVDTVSDLVLLRILAYPARQFDFDASADFYFTPDGQSVIFMQRGIVRRLSLEGDILEERREIDLMSYRPVMYSTDGKQAVTVFQQAFCVWTVYSFSQIDCGSPRVTFPDGQYSQPLVAAAFDADQQRLYAVSTVSYSGIGALLHIFDLTTKREIDRLRIACTGNSAVINQDATLFICDTYAGLNAYAIDDSLDLDTVWSFNQYIDQYMVSADTQRVYIEYRQYENDIWQPYLETRDVISGEVLSKEKLTVGMPYYFLPGTDGSLRFRQGVADGQEQGGLVNAYTGEVIFSPDVNPQQVYLVRFNQSMTLMAIGGYFVSAPPSEAQVRLFGFSDCSGQSKQGIDLNLRAEPSVNAAIEAVLPAGMRIALVEERTESDGSRWWSTLNGWWLRSDVLAVDCPN